MVAKKPTWESYVEAFISAGDFSDNTRKSYQTVLGQFLTDIQPGGKGWETRAIGWKSSLSKTRAPRSVAQRITCVRSFLRWCAGMGYVDRNPMLAVKVRMTQSAAKRALTDAEVQKLLSVTREVGDTLSSKERSSRDVAIFMLMLHTGIRITGARMLDIEDFKDRGELTLAYYVGKGHIGKDAFVVIPGAVLASIEAYLEDGSRSLKDTGPLFLVGDDSQKRMSESGMRTALNRRLEAADVLGPGVTVHSLRHTAATRARKSGASLRDVQRMLDHRSAATTELYLHELDRMDKPAELGIDYGEKIE